MAVVAEGKRAKRREPWQMRELYGDDSGDDVEWPSEEEITAAIEGVVQRALIFVPKLGDNPSLVSDLGLGEFMRMYDPDTWGRCLIRLAEVASISDMGRHLTFYSDPSVDDLRQFPMGLQHKFKTLRNSESTSVAVRQKFDRIVYELYRANPSKRTSDEMKAFVSSYLLESVPAALGLLRTLLQDYSEVVDVSVLAKLYTRDKELDPKQFWLVRQHPSLVTYIGKDADHALTIVEEVHTTIEDAMSPNMASYIMDFI